MSYIELKDIHKSYKLSGKQKFPVLHGIDLTLERGEFVSILGESGGGKSTLMNIIGGMDKDYSGDVLINGKALHAMREKELDDYRKTNVGFIFQSFNLINHMTVLNNVLITLKMTTMSDKERVAHAKELLTTVGLADHLHKRPNQLSGGQKQRVAIARALANNPDIILADEPTGALDKKNSEQIMELLDTIAKQGKLVITVTHSQKVADYGTRIIKIDDGRIADDIRLKNAYPVPEHQVEPKTKNLSIPATFKMALDNIRHNLKRNLLVTIGGSIGIFSVIIMLALGSGVQTYLHDEIMKNINPTVVQLTKKDISQQDGESSHIKKSVTISDSDLAKMEKVKHVKSAEKVLWLSSTRVTLGKKMAVPQYFQTVDGAVPEKDLAKGSHLPGQNEIGLSKDVAKQLTQKPTSLIGKTVTFSVNMIDKKQKPIVMQKKLKVSAIFNGSAQMGMITADYDTVQTMYKKQKLTLTANMATIKIDQIENVKSVQNHFKKAGYRPNGAGAFLDSLTLYISIASYVLAAIAGISLLVSAIMIIVVLYISVSERTKEIGILRAIGARRRDIRHLFFSEASLLGLFSGVIGVALAFIAAAIGNYFAQPHMHVSLLNVTPGFVLFGLLISVGISVIAGLAPSSKAANLDPIESLRKFD
ncbi:ATP-binding cassette domain-containing protein [Sporolactobacillus shoreicorticis]|uniref:ATP-binding cassette domain-containing protein n=1 Tax=Sporolactobacillus shoreicorticis TaxID=1923877 RepID=A0ABW5S934_9BACL|nr:ABC transporter ATP-binding protein/permease [Sporolactobacillus shoreicorticis]MCO7127334.1 ATP-binding cassette domain-containing protein [Sporolactobacillus shoreicorticis]